MDYIIGHKKEIVQDRYAYIDIDIDGSLVTTYTYDMRNSSWDELLKEAYTDFRNKLLTAVDTIDESFNDLEQLEV